MSYMTQIRVVIGAGISGAAHRLSSAQGRREDAADRARRTGERRHGQERRDRPAELFDAAAGAARARQHRRCSRTRKPSSAATRGFVQAGYRFVLSPRCCEGAAKNVAMQRGLGIVNEWSRGPGFPQHLPETQSRKASPASCTSRTAATPIPVQATEAYVAAFKRSGGEFRARTPVRGLMREGDRITGVELDDGEVARRARGQCRRTVGEAARRERRARSAAALGARAGHRVGGAGGARRCRRRRLDGRRCDLPPPARRAALHHRARLSRRSIRRRSLQLQRPRADDDFIARRADRGSSGASRPSPA